MQKKSKNKENYQKVEKNYLLEKQQNIQELTRQNTGITLIALCITIIVILILASITIGAISGDNGILGNAGKAKEDTEMSNEKEIISVAVVQAMGKNKNGSLEEDEFQKELNNKAGEEGIVEAIKIGDGFEVIFTKSNRCYTVDKNGNIGEVKNVIKDNNPGDITVGQDGQELDGSEDRPFEIWCIEDLIEFSQNYINYRENNVILCSNLNFKSASSYANSNTTSYGDINGDNTTETLIREMQNGKGFTPIQDFRSTFDGKNYKIDNIYINADGNAGLFATATGTIKNLEVSGNIISVNGNAGGIVGNGMRVAIVDNCSNFADVTAQNKSAGRNCGV